MNARVLLIGNEWTHSIFFFKKPFFLDNKKIGFLEFFKQNTNPRIIFAHTHTWMDVRLFTSPMIEFLNNKTSWMDYNSSGKGCKMESPKSMKGTLISKVEQTGSINKMQRKISSQWYVSVNRFNTNLDRQYAKPSTVDKDLTKFRSLCLTIWPASVGMITGSNALLIKKNLCFSML